MLANCKVVCKSCSRVNAEVAMMISSTLRCCTSCGTSAREPKTGKPRMARGRFSGSVSSFSSMKPSTANPENLLLRNWFASEIASVLVPTMMVGVINHPISRMVWAIRRKNQRLLQTNTVASNQASISQPRAMTKVGSIKLTATTNVIPLVQPLSAREYSVVPPKRM